jgi:hypothetical protein
MEFDPDSDSDLDLEFVPYHKISRRGAEAQMGPQGWQRTRTRSNNRLLVKGSVYRFAVNVYDLICNEIFTRFKF